MICNDSYTCQGGPVSGWLVLTYSLRSRRSSARVAVWRRLRRIGAISPRGGVYVLPAREECLEALQWLAQEVEHAKGEALVMHVERFDRLDDGSLAALFRQARARDYDVLDAAALKLERAIARKRGRPPGPRERGQLSRLRRLLAEIARIDFFDSPERVRNEARLDRIDRMLSPGSDAAPPHGTFTPAEFQGRRWVTRPNVHVDRLACAWLIRRFIDAAAPIRYADVPEPDEVAFDMLEGPFKHEGNLCTFEVMARAFRLDGAGVRAIGEIAHEIDLDDGRFARPEVPGVDAILRGWTTLSDAERETRGLDLLDGLYAALEPKSSTPQQPSGR